MDRQEFNARFTLLDCLQDGDIRSFSAISRGTDPVTVHLLPAQTHPQHAVLRADIERLIDHGLEGLEFFDLAGRAVAIAGPFEEGETLEGWLLDRLADISEPAADSFDLLMGVPPVPADGDQRGEGGEMEESGLLDEAVSEAGSVPASIDEPGTTPPGPQVVEPDPGTTDTPSLGGVVLGEDEPASSPGGLTQFLVVGGPEAPAVLGEDTSAAVEEVLPSEETAAQAEHHSDEALPETPTLGASESPTGTSGSSERVEVRPPEPDPTPPLELGGAPSDEASGGLTQFFDLSQLERADPDEPPRAEESARTGRQPESGTSRETPGVSPQGSVVRPNTPEDGSRPTDEGGAARSPNAHSPADGFTTLMMGVSRSERAASQPSPAEQAEPAPQSEEREALGRKRVSGLTHQFDRSATAPTDGGSIPETRTSTPIQEPRVEHGSEFSGLAGWRLDGTTPPDPRAAATDDVGLGLDGYMERLRSTPAPARSTESAGYPDLEGPAAAQRPWGSGDDPTILAPASSPGPAGGSNTSQASAAAGAGLPKKTIVVFVVVVTAVVLITASLLAYFATRPAG